jgi:hypothetical protein
MAIAQAQYRSDYLPISRPTIALNQSYVDVCKAKRLPMVSKPDKPRCEDITPVFVGIAG